MRPHLKILNSPARALGLILLLAATAWAQDPPPPALEAPAPAAPQAQPEPPARPQPDLAMPEGLTPSNRDPFWPVGYVPLTPGQTDAAPQGPVAKPATPRWTEARESLRIGGYMKGPRGYMALVNGALVNPGDEVATVFDGKTYHWKVHAISVKGISFIPLEWTPADGARPTTGKDRP